MSSGASIIRYSRDEALELLRAAGETNTINVSDLTASTAPCASVAAARALTVFSVPKLSPDGTCSLVLDPTPFDLLRALHGLNVDDVPSSSPILHRLCILRAIVDELAKQTGAEWVGIYRRTSTTAYAHARRAAEGTASTIDVPLEAEDVLVKEAYVGSPSRPFFPLTSEFAAGSNNSTVGMTRGTVVIHDVRKMGDDEPYYNCDGHVRAEVCVPIVACTCDAGSAAPCTCPCIGIIDAEAWRPGHFTPDRVALVLDVAEQLGKCRLLSSMLP